MKNREKDSTYTLRISPSKNYRHLIQKTEQVAEQLSQGYIDTMG